MTSGAERVRAAIALDVVDSPPVSLWGHEFEKEWFTAALVESTVERARVLELDWIKLHIRASAFGESLGCHFRPNPTGSGQPLLVEPAVRCKSDWYKVIDRAESTTMPQVLLDQLDILDGVLAKVPRDVPVVQTTFSPISVAGYLVGRDHDKVGALLEEDPQLMRRVLGALASYMARFSAESIDRGAAGVFHGIVRYATKNFMDEDAYRAIVLPSDQMALEGASGGWFNIVHLCSTNVFMQLAREMPVHAVSWADKDPGNPSLVEARDMVGKAVVGGLDRYTAIGAGTPADVAAEVRDVFARCGMAGLMVSPGCSVTPLPTDKNSNFHAMVDTVRELAKGASHS